MGGGGGALSPQACACVQNCLNGHINDGLGVRRPRSKSFEVKLDDKQGRQSVAAGRGWANRPQPERITNL